MNKQHNGPETQVDCKRQYEITFDFSIFFPNVESDTSIAEARQFPKEIRMKEMTKASPFLGHFKSLAIVNVGTEGIACARRTGQIGHVKKLAIVIPIIEILSIRLELFTISIKA